MTGPERDINLDAVFLPMVPGDESSRPCLEVAGVQVYAYFDEGTFHVALHYDAADPEVTAQDGCVPTEVTAGDQEVWRG